MGAIRSVPVALERRPKKLRKGRFSFCTVVLEVHAMVAREISVVELNLKRERPYGPAPIDSVLHSFACRAVAVVLDVSARWK